jgi:hypothetical protein
MGLLDDLINARVESGKAMGVIDEDIDTSPGSPIEVEARLTTEAIINFLLKADFRITKLNANMILEDFSIPPQTGDVLPGVQSVGAGNNGLPVNSSTVSGMSGVLNHPINIGKGAGGLMSTGYVFIGGDPSSQQQFDTSDKDGQRDFTTVKLFEEDIEKIR